MDPFHIGNLDEMVPLPSLDTLLKEQVPAPLTSPDVGNSGEEIEVNVSELSATLKQNEPVVEEKNNQPFDVLAHAKQRVENWEKRNGGKL